MPPEADPTPNPNLVESLAPLMALPDRTAVAALDQMQWHLLCCSYLFEGFYDEIVGALKTAADEECLKGIRAAIAQLRTGVETTVVEISVMHFDRRCVSTAESFQDELDAASDPEMVFFPVANRAPVCQKLIGKGVHPCTRPVLYLGSGEWSEGCEVHASSSDRDRNSHWQHRLNGTPGVEAQLRLSWQHTDVAKVLLDWWPTVDCPANLIRDAIGKSET